MTKDSRTKVPWPGTHLTSGGNKGHQIGCTLGWGLGRQSYLPWWRSALLLPGTSFRVLRHTTSWNRRPEGWEGGQVVVGGLLRLSVLRASLLGLLDSLPSTRMFV
jgi:hypothetical protein